MYWFRESIQTVESTNSIIETDRPSFYYVVRYKQIVPMSKLVCDKGWGRIDEVFPGFLVPVFKNWAKN